VERCDAAVCVDWGRAQEFVDQLLGKLEAQLKGTPQENLLRWCFGGVLCHQCFAQPPHGEGSGSGGGNNGGSGGSGVGGGATMEVLRKPDVAEPFLFLELAVKSKANLVESLMDFVKEEQVEGLQWDGHPQGLPSIKRTCIRTLPQVRERKRLVLGMAVCLYVLVQEFARVWPLAKHRTGCARELWASPDLWTGVLRTRVEVAKRFDWPRSNRT